MTLSDGRSFRRLTAYICLMLLGVISAGCAATSTTIIEEEVVTNSRPMNEYKSLIINDFELKRDMYADTSSGRMSEREQRYSQLPAELAEGIERYVKSHHTYKDVLRGGEPSESTLILKGKFTRVGRFKISITASLRDGANGQEVAYFRHTLWDVLDTTATINLLARDLADFIDRIQYK